MVGVLTRLKPLRSHPATAEKKHPPGLGELVLWNGPRMDGGGVSSARSHAFCRSRRPVGRCIVLLCAPRVVPALLLMTPFECGTDGAASLCLPLHRIPGYQHTRSGTINSCVCCKQSRNRCGGFMRQANAKTPSMLTSRLLGPWRGCGAVDLAMETTHLARSYGKVGYVVVLLARSTTFLVPVEHFLRSPKSPKNLTVPPALFGDATRVFDFFGHLGLASARLSTAPLLHKVLAVLGDWRLDALKVGYASCTISPAYHHRCPGPHRAELNILCEVEEPYLYSTQRE